MTPAPSEPCTKASGESWAPAAPSALGQLQSESQAGPGGGWCGRPSSRGGRALLGEPAEAQCARPASWPAGRGQEAWGQQEKAPWGGRGEAAAWSRAPSPGGAGPSQHWAWSRARAAQDGRETPAPLCLLSSAFLWSSLGIFFLLCFVWPVCFLRGKKVCNYFIQISC